MTTSPHLISPQRKKINEHAHMGRYEHENMYHILGMDGEESECSLDEPLFDEGQEISASSSATQIRGQRKSKRQQKKQQRQQRRKPMGMWRIRQRPTRRSGSGQLLDRSK